MRLRTLLPLLFFATGAAGLLYEVVWFRLLETIFGVTTLATSTVLAVFMGGLALGAELASRRADQWKNPIRAYGALEVGLAALALVVPWVLPLANRAFVLVYDALHPSFVVLTILRLLVSAIILLPPATLMGMTLPILAKAFARPGEEGRDVGFLYTINTTGALVGAALGGFVLLPWLGLRGTSFVAVGLNLLAGLPALLFGGLAFLAPSASTLSNPAPTPRSPLPRTLRLLAALSGLAALAYQVFWTRALLLSIGNTVYAFSVILVTVLGGIALGGALATIFLARSRRPLLALAVTQLALALVVVVITSTFDDLPRVYFDLSTKWGGSWHGFLAASFSLAAVGLLPATILLGMGLPLVLGEAVRGSRGLAREVGALYATNTWAGILGSILAGFVLVPLVGIRDGILATAAANGATGLVALAADGGLAPKRRLTLAAAFTILFATLASVFSPWDAETLTSGLHTSGPSNEIAAGGERLIYYREGIAATVSVKKRGRDLKLQVNGRTEATSVGDLKTNTLLGSLPMLLHPEAKSALVIGLGSGVTLAGAASHPLTSIECVELCGEVVEASRFFSAVAGDATTDPRVVMRAEDGRNHLLLTRRTYDVIISQPSNLWAAGVGNLFTKEFFELCRAHLGDNGVLCQWIQGYSVSKSSLRSILATLAEVFPSVDIWVGEWSDLLVTASARETPISVAALEAAFADPRVGASLRRAGIGDVPTLLSHHMLDADAVRLFSQGARLHTDDNRLVEFGEPRSLAEGTATSQSGDVLAWETDVRARIGLATDPDFDARLARAVEARRTEMEGRAKEASGRGGEAIEMLRNAATSNPEDFAIRRNLARLHVRAGVEFARKNDFANASIQLQDAIAADPENPEAAGNFGLLAMLGGADEEALRWTKRAIELDPENETYLTQLADAHRRAGRWIEARDAARAALGKRDDFVPAVLLLAEALAFTNDPEGADRELQRARRLGAPEDEMARIKKLVRQDG